MQYFLTQWTFPQDFKTFYVSIQIDTASVHLRLDTEKRCLWSQQRKLFTENTCREKTQYSEKKKKSTSRFDYRLSRSFAGLFLGDLNDLNITKNR